MGNVSHRLTRSELADPHGLAIRGVPTLTVTKSASLTRALRRPRAVTFRGNGQPGRGSRGGAPTWAHLTACRRRAPKRGPSGVLTTVRRCPWRATC